MQYCTRNPAIKKPELSDASSIIDINDNMDVIDGIICKSNFNGATDPGVGDDIVDGYSVGSNWWNVTDHRLFVAESVATGAAVWRQVWPAFDVSGPLTLQPLGGKVGIGLSDPQAQLHIINNCLISSAGHPAYLLAAQSPNAKRWAMVSTDGDFVIRNDTNGVNIVHIYNSGGMSLGSSVVNPGVNNLYVTGNVNCASVTDHTPGYSGDALKELKRTRSNAQGEIIHQTLPRFARAKFIDAATGEETEGRNIGNMVSVLTRAVQQLMEKLEVAERKIEQLEEEIQ